MTGPAIDRFSDSHPGRCRRAALLAAGALALLAGCSGTLLPKPAPPPARFTLDAGAALTTPPAAAAASAPTLVLAAPRAAPGHDSRRMLYQRRPQALEAFAFHEWVEPPAQMLAPLMLRALQQGAGFHAVLLAPTAGAAGWRLETEQLRLLQDFGSAPSQARLSLRAVLLDGATRQVIAWREFDVAVAAAADDPVAGAHAAHRATQQLLAQLAAFCAEQLRLRR